MGLPRAKFSDDLADDGRKREREAARAVLVY